MSVEIGASTVTARALNRIVIAPRYHRSSVEAIGVNLNGDLYASADNDWLSLAGVGIDLSAEYGPPYGLYVYEKIVSLDVNAKPYWQAGKTGGQWTLIGKDPPALRSIVLGRVEHLHAFGITAAEGEPFMNWYSGFAPNWQDSWTRVGTNAPKNLKSLTPATIQDGPFTWILHLIAIDSKHEVWVTYRSNSGTWQAWQQWTGAPRLAKLVAAEDPFVPPILEAWITLLGLGLDGRLHCAIRHSGDDWKSWEGDWKGAPRLVDVSTGFVKGSTGLSQNLHVFGVRQDTFLPTCLFRDNLGHWGTWQSLPTNNLPVPQLQRIVGVGNYNNSMKAIGVDFVDRVHVNNRNGNGTWSGWQVSGEDVFPVTGVKPVSRRNQRTLSVPEQAAYVTAVKELKQTGIYDQFVQLHAVAFKTSGWAHQGPVFLPWHRWFLLLFEQHLRRINPALTIPYWDWTEPDAGNPATNPLFGTAFMGGDGAGPDSWVDSGPFRHSHDWELVIDTRSKYLQRMFGKRFKTPKLPTSAQVQSLTEAAYADPYDRAPWDRFAVASFRNYLEGFQLKPGWPSDAAVMHNYVHAWIGGSMNAGSSPNEPIFFLHHANIDRIWALWQQNHPTSKHYLPDVPTSNVVSLNDYMLPWNGDSAIDRSKFPALAPIEMKVSPAMVLNIDKLGFTYA